MTYMITKSDGSFLIDIPDNKLDTDSSSITLLGKDVVNYGLYVDQNFISIMQRFANIEGTARPLVGQLWYDSHTHTLRVFNNVSWDIVSSIDSSAGTIIIEFMFWDVPVKVVAYVSNFQILSIFSYYQIAVDFLPDSYTINDTVYAVKSLFPYGLDIGENLAKVSNVTLAYYGNAYSANALQTSKTISITGEFTGNVQFDGNSNVNVAAFFGNIYVANSNVTVAGMHTNVTVDDTGRIISVGNITYNDVVRALEYVPFSSANVNVDNVPSTVVIRDGNGSFSANTVTGTTTYTSKFTSNVALTIEGDVIGESTASNGIANVIIQSNLMVLSNLTAGVYNTITVNEKGIVQSGIYQESMPVGSIVLYNNSVVIPEGWAPCNGANVVTPTGDTINTPNYSNVAVGGSIYIIKVFKNIYLPSNDTVVGTLSIDLVSGGTPIVTFIGGPDIAYPPLVFSNVNVAITSKTISTYTKVKKITIPTGYRGSDGYSGSNLYNGRDYSLGDILYFDFPNFDNTATATVTEVTSNGGISKLVVTNSGRYVPFIKNGLGSSPSSITNVYAAGGRGSDAAFNLEVETVNTTSLISDVDFGDNLFFDAVSLTLSGGDPNAVMLSQVDIFGDLSNLTVLQIIDNLTLRKQSGLPPRIGKYMLSLDDIKNYAGVMQIPVNTTNFSIALQNRLMVIKVTDISNEYAYQGFYPSDDKIFGACYIGIMQYLAVLRGVKTDLVGNTLVNAGLSLTGLNTIDGLTNAQLITYSSKMIVNAKTAIYNNTVARNSALEINKLTGKASVPVPPQLVPTPLLTTGNANIIVSESIIDGLPVIFGGAKLASNSNIQFGGGSFINSGVIVNDNVFSSINDSRYGASYNSGGSTAGGGSGGGGGGDGGSTAAARLSLNSGTGSAIPGGGAAPVAGVPGGGTTGSPTYSPVAGGYYGALQGQESGGNYSVFSGNGNYAGDLTSQSFAAMAAAGRAYDKAGGPSSAAGGWQFIAATIEGTILSPAGIAAGLSLTALATVENQNKLVEVFTANNAAYLSSKNVPAIDAYVAGAHLLGSGGMVTLYSAASINPNTPCSALFSADAVRNNPILGTTVGAALEYFNRKYGSGTTWKNGVKSVPGITVPVVTTTTLPTTPTTQPSVRVTVSSKSPNIVPPTPSELVTGVTKAIGIITDAFSPPPVITQTISAIVPQSVKQVFEVATAVATVYSTAVGTAAETVLNNVTKILNNALNNSGVQPPVVKPPTATGSADKVPVVAPKPPVYAYVATPPVTPKPSNNSNNSNTGNNPGNPNAPGYYGGSGGSSGGSGVSANNNGSISVASAPATRNPGSSATYGVSNTPSKPTSGGTGGGGADSGQAANVSPKPSSPAAGSGCFVYETDIEMADGTTKPIGTIRLGDQTRGGEVVAIHCYDGAPLYEYLGVHVSGTHYVIENGVPIMVQDSAHAIKINNVYGLYTIDTTGRRIFVNGIEFADHNGDGVITEFFKNAEKTSFESTEEIYHEILNQVKNAKL